MLTPPGTEEGRGFEEDHYFGFVLLKVGLGILQITFSKRYPQFWPWFDRSIFSTNCVGFDQAV